MPAEPTINPFLRFSRLVGRSVVRRRVVEATALILIAAWSDALTEHSDPFYWALNPLCWLLIILAALCLLDAWLVHVRVRSGAYGDCEVEVREAAEVAARMAKRG